MKNRYFIILASALLGLAATACNDYPDRYEVTGGTPKVVDIRYAEKDVHIDQAYMGEIICLLGSNLTSVQQMYFNDQAATLNTSYITDNTLIVDVPGNMPDVTTNKIYLINKDLDTTAVDFKVLPPNPVLSSMSCEWAEEGQTVTLKGKYLFAPLTISFPGAEVDESTITYVSSTEITCQVPAGAQPGYVNLTTESGTARSAFQYKDTRNMLFDWDGKYGEAHATGYGWRAGMIHSDGQDSWSALDGNYLYFGGATIGPGPREVWAEDQYCVNYWPDVDNPGNGWNELNLNEEFAEYIAEYGVSGLSLKFEVIIPSSTPWTASALQIMFTRTSDVSCWGNCTNAFYYNDEMPRYVWEPWVDAGGSYTTEDEWITVTVPLSDFNKTIANATCGVAFGESFLTGLTLFVYGGSTDGTECSPEFGIDNIRVVPSN